MTEKTFREAYGVLQRHSETLRNQREPNIDDLLTIVTESVQAYQVCKARIDAVSVESDTTRPPQTAALMSSLLTTRSRFAMR